VGAIIEGVVPTVIDQELPEPFVAVVSFARLGPPTVRSHEDGRTFVINSILEGDTQNARRSAKCDTLAVALNWLEHEKQRLLSAGWAECAFDPEADPD